MNIMWDQRRQAFADPVDYRAFIRFVLDHGWTLGNGHARARIRLRCGRYDWQVPKDNTTSTHWMWVRWKDK